MTNLEKLLRAVHLQLTEERPMVFKSKALIAKVKQILGFAGGGVQKRIDENRELYDLLSNKAPDFMASHPWVASWLQSHDEFFCALAEHVPVDSERFTATPVDHPGRPFPRPWQVKDHAIDHEATQIEMCST